MDMFRTTATTLLLLLSIQNGSLGYTTVGNHARQTKTMMGMARRIDEASRRSFVGKVTAISTATLIGSLGEPAEALFGSGLKKVNAKLENYGLPQITSVPDGFTPLLEVYGKGQNRSPLLVQFLHPADWVVTLPNNDENGEDGTIQAGQYAAGDTATFYVYSGVKSQDVTQESKDYFQNAIVKAISQKGDNVYQNFKVVKVVPATNGNQNYAIVDFKYDLLTGAGFEVARVGVASVTSQGNDTQVLWCASTRTRYKKTETALRTIADSFRVYSEGIKFSDALFAKEDKF